MTENKCFIERVETDISPYDISFPAQFFTSTVSTCLQKAESMIEKIYKEVMSDASIVTQLQQSTKKGFRLVVDATEDTLNAIEKGQIKLSMDKSGRTFAQVRRTDGKYGSKLPIKRETFGKGIDPVQMANAMQMKALQKQIKDISDQIYFIDSGVQEILQGQQNDRIGLYYSGVSLFLESRNISDTEMRKMVVAQALKALSDSTFQLTLKIQSDINYLANKEYEEAKGKKSRESLISSRMDEINQSFAFIHQATMLKAGTYCEIGEYTAMASVLDEYSYFIKNTIQENVSLLAQCDIKDNGAEDGIWKSRAKMELNVSDFTNQIKAKDKVIYLKAV